MNAIPLSALRPALRPAVRNSVPAWILFASFVVGTASAQSTHRVSVDSSGKEVKDGGGGELSISADGHVTAFVSASKDLVGGDVNARQDVFVHDDSTGTTVLASLDSAGAQSNANSSAPSLSGDGHLVAFQSVATNLVAGDTNSLVDVFVRDLAAGTTERASVDSSGVEGDGPSYAPALSADGRFVAFTSAATNLVAGDTNARLDVFVRDLQAGTIERVSVDSAGSQGDAASRGGALSGDGRFVAFISSATNLVVGDTNQRVDVFVRDRLNGTTERVSVDSAGLEVASNSDDLSTSAISGDGRYVVFGSAADTLVPNDGNQSRDIFVRDRATGTTERVSVATDGSEVNGWSFTPAISADGRFVTFWSWANDLVPGDFNNAEDVFVHDRGTARTTRVSVDPSGYDSDYFSEAPAISEDGQFVVFRSLATNLVTGDTNAAVDVFVRDRGPALPEVTDVAPAIGPYDAVSVVTVRGFNFLGGTSIDVRFAGQSASNVNVLDNFTLTCTVAGGPSGPATVTVQTSLGTGDLADGFAFTPCVLAPAVVAPGDAVAIDYLCDPFDGILAIAGVPPVLAIPTPPFDSTLAIAPFTILFVMPPGVWPYDDLPLSGSIPKDPSLAGATILLQALIGPSFTPPKHATWTNCRELAIR